jgi:hypothetical protein
MAQREHNEAVVTLLSLEFEGRRQMLSEMRLRVLVWNTAHQPRWGIRIGPPDTPLVVAAQQAPAYNVSKGMEYRHYIWHEIAGLVEKLLTTYGEDGDDGAHEEPSATGEDGVPRASSERGQA